MHSQGFAATEAVPNAQQGLFVVSTDSVTSAALHARAGVLRGKRRITREQGRALERIGHAADYLFDTYIEQRQAKPAPFQQGMHPASPELDAIRMLAHARNRILQSLPIVEPLSHRIWSSLGCAFARPKAGPQFPPAI